MEINTNISAGGINGPIPPRQPAKAKEAADGVSFGNSAALDGALQNVPGSRPEEVDRARNLIGDVNYPPQETIKKISTLLAIHLD
jgi:hypothetical protein